MTLQAPNTVTNSLLISRIKAAFIILLILLLLPVLIVIMILFVLDHVLSEGFVDNRLKLVVLIEDEFGEF